MTIQWYNTEKTNGSYKFWTANLTGQSDFHLCCSYSKGETVMSKIKLECILEEYLRYEHGSIYRVVAEGATTRKALLKLLDNIGMYTNSESILEMEEEQQRKFSVKEIINIIENENGDGCDFIFVLRNMSNGKNYIQNMFKEYICE